MSLTGETETLLLKAIGLEDRECLADPSLVAPDLRRALPPQAREFREGSIPKFGFGIGGEAGVGKTCAMVALLKMHLRAAYERRRQAQDPPIEPSRMRSMYCWVDWPRMAHELRTNAVADPEWVALQVKTMASAQVLILDDLGAERRKGDYQDDYAAGELDFIVASSRYRSMLPTWYTTNLPLAKLADFYGARFVSRLVSESPLVELVGPDRRASR
jgi:DNA replication protein DnaC